MMFFWRKQKTALLLKLIHVEPAMSGIFCFGREGIEDLTEAASQELLHAIQPITPQPIQYLNPWEWKLSVPLQLKTFPLKKVIHQEISPYMPSGKEAGEWKRWMTEVQMLLHENPINKNRENLNQKTVNWVWIEAK